MEKEHQPDSMATVTIKPEYPPSEVYSSSEPPPAYRQQRLSNSVQIARIAALTIVVSAVILGSFILASSWVAARAGCQQLEQLDAMLDKELALEGRQMPEALVGDEPLPLSGQHALRQLPPQAAAHSRHEDALLKSESKVNEDRLQSLDDDSHEQENEGSSNSEESDDKSSSSSDSSAADEDDEMDLDRSPIHIKLPMQLDLDDLAGALMAHSQKGRMNCMVERRREEAFPFNIFNILGGARAPRPAGDRIAIICDSGDGEQTRQIPDPAAQVFAFPLGGPMRLPMARPALAAALQPPPAPVPNQMSVGSWENAGDSMVPPQGPPREIRVHVQRVFALPRHPAQIFNGIPQEPPQENPRPERIFALPRHPAQLFNDIPQQRPEESSRPEAMPMPNMPNMPIPMPNMPMPMESFGLSAADLRDIHRTVQETVAAAQQREAQQQEEQQNIDNHMEEVKTIVSSLEAAASQEDSDSAQDSSAQMEQDNSAPQMPQQPQPQLVMGDRRPHARLLPVHIPVNMMTQQQDDQMVTDEQRPHYVQPRSVY